MMIDPIAVAIVVLAFVPYVVYLREAYHVRRSHSAAVGFLSADSVYPETPKGMAPAVASIVFASGDTTLAKRTLFLELVMRGYLEITPYGNDYGSLLVIPPRLKVAVVPKQSMRRGGSLAETALRELWVWLSEQAKGARDGILSNDLFFEHGLARSMRPAEISGPAERIVRPLMRASRPEPWFLRTLTGRRDTLALAGLVQTVLGLVALIVASAAGPLDEPATLMRSGAGFVASALGLLLFLLRSRPVYRSRRGRFTATELRDYARILGREFLSTQSVVSPLRRLPREPLGLDNGERLLAWAVALGIDSPIREMMHRNATNPLDDWRPRWSEKVGTGGSFGAAVILDWIEQINW